MPLTLKEAHAKTEAIIAHIREINREIQEAVNMGLKVDILILEDRTTRFISNEKNAPMLHANIRANIDDLER